MPPLRTSILMKTMGLLVGIFMVIRMPSRSFRALRRIQGDLGMIPSLVLHVLMVPGAQEDLQASERKAM